MRNGNDNARSLHGSGHRHQKYSGSLSGLFDEGHYLAFDHVLALRCSHGHDASVHCGEYLLHAIVGLDIAAGLSGLYLGAWTGVALGYFSTILSMSNSGISTTGRLITMGAPALALSSASSLLNLSLAIPLL